MQASVDEVAQNFYEGRLERREALKFLFRMGLRGAAAYAALGLLPAVAQDGSAGGASGSRASPPPPSMPPEIGDPKAYITEQSKLLAQIAADPKVQSQLTAIQAAQIAQRPALAVELMKTIQSLPELQKRSTDDLRLSLRVFEREAQTDRNLGFGELSKDAIVTAKTIRELNQKLRKEGTTPSLLTPPTERPLRLPSDLQPRPIPGLDPRLVDLSPLPDTSDPTKPPIPPRPIDPYALTICGSFGIYGCVSVGG